jgi:hypothetical protein
MEAPTPAPARGAGDSRIIKLLLQNGRQTGLAPRRNRRRRVDHPLKEFLDAVDDSVSAFARRIGVEAAALQEIIDGEQWPEPAIARRIVDATDGAVSFAALYGEENAPADLAARRIVDDSLDEAALSATLRAAMEQAAGAEKRRAFSREIDMAVEAVANTYAALARVTTRRNLEDRVAQALRPVLAEILQDYAANSVLPADLDQAANQLAARYCARVSRRPSRPR